MKQVLFLALICFPLFSSAQEQEVPDTDEKDSVNALSGLLSYNFSGKNPGFSNLTPIIEYGWKKIVKIKSKLNWRIGINPYSAGQIEVKDSSNYIPSLMLPGLAGINFTSFFEFRIGESKLSIAPINLGFKLISDFADSTVIIAQHNIRSAIGFRYNDLFTVGVQYTMGWHNSTSQSEKMFAKIFPGNSNKLSYMMISLQTKLSNSYSKTDTYLFAEWRGAMNKEKLKAFDNLKIITFGIRTDMNFESIAPAKKVNN